MSHEITNRDALAYTGKTPWHGIGTKLTPDATLEQWVEEAGLNYTVEAAPVGYVAGKNGPKICKKRLMLFAGDNGDWFETVSDKYCIHQPRQIVEFYRDLSVNNGFTMDVLGTMSGRRRIWCLAKSPREFDIYGDKIEEYVLLSTNYTGDGSTVFQDTGIRVVCKNTFDLAMHSSSTISKRLSHKMEFNASILKGALGLEDEQRDSLKAALKVFADTTVTDSDKAKFVLDVSHPRATQEQRKEYISKPSRTMENLYRVLNKGEGQQGIQDTVYGLFNGVTRFEDHERNERATGARLTSAWFGHGSSIKSLAWDLCVKDCVAAKSSNAEILRH
jgi:phage/plasmid-like protein (TIGR03299 family)